jgi:phage gpG-like protein
MKGRLRFKICNTLLRSRINKSAEKNCYQQASHNFVLNKTTQHLQQQNNRKHKYTQLGDDLLSICTESYDVNTARLGRNENFQLLWPAIKKASLAYFRLTRNFPQIDHTFIHLKPK